MPPRLRNVLVAIAASLIAVYMGWKVAEGAYGWPTFAAVITVATVLVRFTGLPADTIFFGLLLFGYIVGNRGFAQLMPAPGLPLLPAEAGLLLALAWRTIAAAFERTLPFRPDPLNWLVLLWLTVGTARFVFDVPRYGFTAVRDFAVVYYASFFFFAQYMCRHAAARRYFIGTLVVAVVALVPAYFLFLLFPDFFFNQLTVRGVPLIYFKGDLAATYMAIGSLLLFHVAQGMHRLWAWPLSAGMFLFVASGDNRASMLGMVVAAGCLLLRRKWRFPAFQGVIGCLALLLVMMLATAFNHTWSVRKLHGLADRMASIVDFTGARRYESEESYFKGDNNRFRLVWWKNVLEETWATNPVFGLGFGADLAHGFLQEYYPDSMEEFSTRSPHNIFLTVFGRMGLVGLLVWIGLCIAIARRVWSALRLADAPATWSIACGLVTILVSATFGVVLEGPMGAVPFWILLGVLSVDLSKRDVPDSESTEAAKLEAPSTSPVAVRD